MKEKKGAWEEIRPPLKKGMTMTQKHKIDLKQRGKDMKQLDKSVKIAAKLAAMVKLTGDKDSEDGKGLAQIIKGMQKENVYKKDVDKVEPESMARNAV